MENLLECVIDSAFDGIMAFKSVRNGENEIVDFEWIFANKNAADIVGFTVPELIGSSMKDKLPGNFSMGLFEQYQDVVETGIPIKFNQYYAADGLDGWFQISASVLDDGFAVTFEDVSDKRQLLAELRTKGKKCQHMFMESIDPIFWLDQHLNFTDANTAFQELFGLDRNTLNHLFVGHLFYLETDYQMFKNTLKSRQKIDEMEIDLGNKNGAKLCCLINMSCVYDEEKKVNYLGVVRDMTKRKQAEQDILMAEKISMTGKIARTIGHEIRNPLTNITLALDQLREEIPGELKDAEMYINIIERNSKRICKLIADLLRSSKPKEL